LRGCSGRKIRLDLPHDPLIRFAMMRAQILRQVLCRVALSCSVADYDNSTAGSQSIADSLVEVSVLRSALALLS
jgi:hypothetical protein